MNTEDLTQRVFELDERVTRHTEQIKTCFGQISELKALAESVNSLAVSVQLMARGQEDIKEKVSGVAADLEEIKGRPARRWDTVITVAVTVIVTAVVTFVLSSTGLK